MVSPYPLPQTVTPIDDRKPGAVVSVKDPPQGVDGQLTELGVTVKRIVYRSTSGVDGAPTRTSAIAVIPNGPPPPGGWTMVAYGHGNTGVIPHCAPSLYSSLLGNAKIIAGTVIKGYAVVMPDLQGLGEPGPVNPFFDGRTYGYNMIDSIRAFHAIAPTILSTKWISSGLSLGGLASWGAIDLANDYGQGLDLLGGVTIVPAADMTDLVDKAQAGTLTRDQYPVWVYLLQSLAQGYPSQVNLDDFRSASAKAKWPALIECLPTGNPSLLDVLQARDSLTPDDLRPKSRAAADFVRRILRQRALPVARATAPTLVMYGTADPLVDTAWTERVIARSCDEGSKLFIVKRIGETHSNIDSSQTADFLNTLRSGGPTISNCGNRP